MTSTSEKPARSSSSTRLVAEVHPHRQLTGVSAGDLLIAPKLPRADLHGRALVERVDGEHAVAQLEGAAVGGVPPYALRRVLRRQRRAAGGAPPTPHASVRVRRLVVEQQRPAGHERLVEAPERLLVLGPAAAEAEDAARHDGAVTGAAGRARAGAGGAAAERVRAPSPAPDSAPACRRTRRCHRRRSTGVQPRYEQPPRATPGVECGLPACDELPEVVDLGAVGVELGPPVGDQAVVPGLRFFHGSSLPGLPSTRRERFSLRGCRS